MGAQTVQLFVMALFVGLLALSAITDLHEYRIPNRIVIAVAALYPAYVLTTGVTVDWMWAILVALGVFAYGLVLFAVGWMGGGDVKLMAATALWAGPEYVFEFMILTTIFGGMMALFMRTGLRWGAALVADRFGLIDVREKLMNEVLPYGLAIAVGGIAIAARLMASPI